MPDVETWKIIRSEYGYGWRLWLGPRIRINSPASLTPMRPRIYRGGDEHCNDTICLHLWPLFGIDVWWRWRQRTEADGPCDKCVEDMSEWARVSEGTLGDEAWRA